GHLQLNGGPTLTMALQSGSPAIDAGVAAACPSHDQRFAPRSGGCGIGAYEVGGNGSAGPGRSSSVFRSPRPAGATAPPPPAASAAPSSQATSAAPSKASAAKAARTLSARGSIRGAGGKRASFTLRGTAGKTAGLLDFSDPNARVRLHVTRLTSVAI